MQPIVLARPHLQPTIQHCLHQADVLRTAAVRPCTDDNSRRLLIASALQWEDVAHYLFNVPDGMRARLKLGYKR